MLTFCLKGEHKYWKLNESLANFLFQQLLEDLDILFSSIFSELEICLRFFIVNLSHTYSIVIDGHVDNSVFINPTIFSWYFTIDFKELTRVCYLLMLLVCIYVVVSMHLYEGQFYCGETLKVMLVIRFYFKVFSILRLCHSLAVSCYYPLFEMPFNCVLVHGL